MPASLTSVLQSTSPFVVLKFGGTSVATAARWHTIAAEAQKRLDEGLRPVIVCSAMTRVSDTLEKLVHEAVGGRHEPLLAQLRARHAELAEALDLPIALLDEDFAELERLALGASLLRDSSPRIKARTMAIGELLSTRLGAAFLSARGLATSFVDARTCFVSDDDPAHPEL